MIERGGRSAPVAWLVGLAALAAGGCDSGDARHVDDAGGDGGIDADDGGGAGGGRDAEDALESSDAEDVVDGRDAIPGGCPAPIADMCPPDANVIGGGPFVTLPVMLRASELGTGVTLVNVAPGPLVLAERADASGRTIVLRRMDGGSSPADGELALPSTSTMHAVAAAEAGTDSSATALPRFVVLACDGAACALFGADLVFGETTVLDALPGGTVPGSPELRGLWWETGPAVCAYGDGVRCFDGLTWSSPISSDPSRPLLVDAATCRETTTMVGGEGRVATSGWPTWTDEPGRSHPDLLAVACSERDLLCAGADGVVLEDCWRSCRVADEAIAFLGSTWMGLGWSLVGATASGRVFIGERPYGSSARFCYTGAVVGPFIAAAAADCGINFNLLLVTADTLYGTDGCAVE
jgi:hypothetical protein